MKKLIFLFVSMMFLIYACQNEDVSSLEDQAEVENRQSVVYADTDISRHDIEERIGCYNSTDPDRDVL